MRLLRWLLLWLLLPRCRRHSSNAAVAVPHSHAVAASRIEVMPPTAALRNQWH